jgi:hypothetical protein
MKKKVFILSLSSILTLNLFGSIMNATEASAATDATTIKIFNSLIGNPKGKKALDTTIEIIENEIKKNTQTSSERYVSLNASMFKKATEGLKDYEIKVLELKIKEELIQKGYTLVDGRYSIIPFNFSIVWK